MVVLGRMSCRKAAAGQQLGQHVHSPAPPCQPLPSAAAPGVFYFNDSTTNTTIILDTHPSSYDDAADSCRKYGAQLVSWDTYD